MPFLVLLFGVAALLAKVAWLLVAVVVTAAVGRLVGGWLARRDEWSAFERSRRADLCARADQQHAAVLAGDLLGGVHGDYPPAPW